jgi:intracellular septation protein
VDGRDKAGHDDKTGAPIPWASAPSDTRAHDNPRAAGYLRAMEEKRQRPAGLRLALDLGPRLIFYVANARFGIFAATATFMVAMLIALAVSYVMIRRLPLMTIVTAIVVAVFGTLTLVLHDETFIKLKPTIIYVLFGGILLGGLAFGKSLLAMVFDSVFDLDEAGWRKLTLRWALFFLFLAVLNEIVWRTQPTDTWVTFKVFGVVPLTFLFAMLQYPLLTRHGREKSQIESRHKG